MKKSNPEILMAMAALGVIAFWFVIALSTTIFCMWILESRNLYVLGVVFFFSGTVSYKISMKLLDYLAKKFD
jgi:hypothetical protein